MTRAGTNPVRRTISMTRRLAYGGLNGVSARPGPAVRKARGGVGHAARDFAGQFDARLFAKAVQARRLRQRGRAGKASGLEKVAVARLHDGSRQVQRAVGASLIARGLIA